ncbi:MULTISPECIES: type II toxin-antitoxin system VapC family toxin [unclassified Mesorhizobium]|uniref:type II toxin-antitoxin system VapC family toxin n=2 Tax=Mesorhizobium TaxID=68287 RepID=UPI000BB0B076|nr:MULTISPECIES: type II toxin-antitoxin system VapC family toxin [unclassified Mesorhizobium]PBB43451.1 VapC toxin family PIN domain ribonuclease [Mesorhizobium sp. WSM3866]RUV99190.1 type II toxin-antitoxin system VapC family toxin [Mesorhizobium sp. M1A.F.Ca.IN.020.04.1.1]RUW08946.1 type II toxin-antitoxin system VapC family toxin [Mesorhizobium sp. M1A.F.Ca.IN.020.03.1.1]RWF75823.1 MAG: type II toxin-antitoxin system VapC family toxin [Mesorhizobium sp.]RWG12437.1 MAG: type II toxin-antito
MNTENLLLDTCAVIWISQDEPIADAATTAISKAPQSGTLNVSVMSAWEMGMLVSKGRLPSTKTPDRWFDEFVEAAAVTVEGVTPRILIAASYLPAVVHSDPMDRILIATARERDLTIVTRDKAILAYAAQGHVRAIAC